MSYIDYSGLGCGVKRFTGLTNSTTTKTIEKRLAGFFKLAYGGQSSFIYTSIQPTWTKTLANLESVGFKVAAKTRTGIVLILPTPLDVRNKYKYGKV